MRVKLAGFNIDTDVLRRLDPDGQPYLTPETLSAAYARISRSSLPVDQLRKKACQDVVKARRSNQRIIFEMGHHSVAEHAVFNFDIMGVSRLALEEIEKFRLVSYTEKSQRYVTLEGDQVMPREIGDAECKKLFLATVRRQNRFYFKAFHALHRRLRRRFPQELACAGGRKQVENWAKEDSRYILPLASRGQVGMTINARNLEHLLRRFRLSPRREVREIGAKLYALVLPIAPSIILFPEPSPFERQAFPIPDESPESLPRPRMAPAGSELKIVSSTPAADDLLLASGLAARHGLGLPAAALAVKRLPQARKRSLFRDFFRSMQFFDAPPREFEMAGIAFQAIVSASNFAQLKRHRMATLLAANYDPELGCTVPESIREAGLDGEFMEIIEATDRAFRRLGERVGAAADYLLTNSHRRRVLMKMNLRELYHFVRLRADENAQWDIRGLALRLAAEAKKRMPLAAMMLCGKSAFAEEFARIYGEPPRANP
ncbi:MAG: FAD-dependent thymidylate synthase [Candidatus Aminicenantes bacterium]|nr:FAD-dependent thymidylate synthase [Candidatus Aminicenantes bacterium]